MPFNNFKERTHRALLISLCIHLIFLISMTIALRKKIIYQDEDVIDADIISVIKPRVILPRLKPAVAQERRQVGKSVKSFSAKTSTDINFEQFSYNKTVMTSSTEDDFAQTSLRIETEGAPISTAVEGVRDAATTIPSSPAARGTGWGGRGKRGFGMRKVTKGRNSAEIFAAIGSTGADGDIDLKDEVPDKKDDLPTIPNVKFSETLSKLAEEIVEDSEGGPIDVVFVVDTSGSMRDNIRQVAMHLKKMADVYEASEINYSLGLVQFRVPNTKGKRIENSIKIWQVSRDFDRCQAILRSLSAEGDEHAYDAVHDAVFKTRFRPTSQKHFILVTDEPFTSARGLSFEEVVGACNEFYIKVNVLGIEEGLHEALAEQTGGHWHKIPAEKRPGNPRNPFAQGRSQARRFARRAATSRRLSHATWAKTAEISNHTLKKVKNNSIDVILFIDASKSMEDKLSEFWRQLEKMRRDWDNARLDYRVGLVRFRAGAGDSNYVSVFQPPQTLEQIKKILELPCQGDERLLDAIAEGLPKIRFRPDATPHIIIVTDEPSKGKHSKDAVTNMCLRTGATISVIGTFDEFQGEIVAKTGGVWMPIPNGKGTNEPVW